MGLGTSLYTGVSGLSAQGEALGMIGDNIANAHTIGFKTSRAEFESVIAQTLKGSVDRNQTGRGTMISAVTPILIQGDIETTERMTDLAISGRGFFVLKGDRGLSFTRNGAFRFDRQGYLVSNDDQRVQGFLTDKDGNVTDRIGSILFPKALTPARSTQNIFLKVNLDSRAEPIPRFNSRDPYNTSHFSSGIEIYDSQGRKHLTFVFFNKTKDRVWEYHGMVASDELVDGDSRADLTEVFSGELSFTVDGRLDTEVTGKNSINFKGGALQNQSVNLDFGDSITTDKGDGINASVQYAKEPDMLNWDQDGSPAGNIVNVNFSNTGMLVATYSNGSRKGLAQVAVSRFENPEGLLKVIGNRFQESTSSGEASIGKPGQGGRGQLVSKSIERSTTDLALQFMSLIQNQRAFQANAKVISTTDDLLASVINIKR